MKKIILTALCCFQAAFLVGMQNNNGLVFQEPVSYDLVTGTKNQIRITSLAEHVKSFNEPALWNKLQDLKKLYIEEGFASDKCKKELEVNMGYWQERQLVRLQALLSSKELEEYQKKSMLDKRFSLIMLGHKAEVLYVSKAVQIPLKIDNASLRASLWNLKSLFFALFAAGVYLVDPISAYLPAYQHVKMYFAGGLATAGVAGLLYNPYISEQQALEAEAANIPKEKATTEAALQAVLQAAFLEEDYKIVKNFIES